MTGHAVGLQLDALRPLGTLAGLTALYQQLGYETDAEPERFEPTDPQVGLSDAAAADVAQAYLLTHDESGTDLLQHWHFELKKKPDGFTVRRVTEQFLKRSGDYLLSFSGAHAPYASVQFVKPRKEVQADGKTLVRLSKLTVTPGRPTPHDLSILRAIALKGGTTPTEAHKKQIEAFSVERVTKVFYKTYHDLFMHVRDVIREQNPNAVIQSTPERHIALVGGDQTEDQKRALHAFTQRLLGRLLFLYFIQKKGWLDGNEHYITELYTTTVQAGNNFYRDALEPLYFETLNTPIPPGTERGIPYLNGSLFEREYPDTTVLNLPDSLFDPANDGDGAKDPGGILHVLNSFNFTIGESAALEQDISLDPEMLGKVFENLMEEDDAAKSGTFYTPRSIVQFMAEETLTRYLHDQTGIHQERLLPLCGDDSDPYDLSNPEARQIRAALAQVRVLDPAVGTASMLVGFLSAMIRVRRSVEAKLGTYVIPGSPTLADWKREYIQTCLYGVDIKHEAIEIARLRLWLSLVVDATEPEPLPNLDYKLMAGDGLLETVDGSPFIKAQTKMLGGQGDVTALADEIGRLHDLFFNEQNHDRKRELREQIQQRERELFRASVDDRIKNLDLELTALTRQIEDTRQTDAAKTKLLKRQAVLCANLEALRLQRRKVWDEHEPLPFFLHDVHFGEVTKGAKRDGNGGFDIVIGNPPYVSIGNMLPEYKTALKTAFPEVASGRADLYVYFFQKGLNLLRDGGRLAFITPNKYARAVYGENLRGVLSTKTRLELFVDFGNLPVFDAITSPLITMFRKAQPDAQPVPMVPERALKAHLSEHLPDGITSVRDGLSGFHIFARSLINTVDVSALTINEWTLDDPRVLKFMNKLRVAGRPLGEVIEGKFFYGIKTGLNKAFVIDESTRADLIASDPHSIEVIKPFIGGSEIRNGAVNWRGKYLINANRGFDLARYPAVGRWLEKFRDALEKRATAGLHPWYELQQPQGAYQNIMLHSKIIYPDMSPSFNFVLDDNSYFLSNTVYFMDSNHKWLLSLLTSKTLFAFFTLISSRLESGSFRFFTSYMEQLPIAFPTPEQERQLEEFSYDARLNEMNALVYELYDLSIDEIALVEELTAGVYENANQQPVVEEEG